MLLLSTDHIPIPHEIEAVFGMIEATYPIQISKEGPHGVFVPDTNEHEEALTLLLETAPSGANAIIGIKVSSATHRFREGTFLYITYIGTPVTYRDKSND